MFIIDLIRRRGQAESPSRRKRHLFAIASGCLGICTLLLFAAHVTFFAPATISVAAAKEEQNITALPLKSAGCGKPSPIAPGTSATQMLFSGGMLRFYLLHIPRGYQSTVGQPLVLNFHGHSSNALQQRSRTGFSALADRHDVIVAYPQGVVGPDLHTGWDTGPRRNPSTNDVLFVSALLQHLQANWCVNPHRIYATGFSNGGGMTNVLACKMAGSFAAFAAVSGAFPAVPGGCHPARPVPFMELHGTADTTVPYTGSLAKGYPPIALWLRQWAQRDDCTSGPTIFYKQANVIGEKWSGCRDDVTIIHYIIGGMGHMWPRHMVMRTPAHTTTPDATALIWTFFQDYSLPPLSYRS